MAQRGPYKTSRSVDDAERTPDGGFKIKTYYPTLEQMRDFSDYMRYIHEDGGHRAGLAKIVPPPEYKPRKSGYNDEALYNMEITTPIKQEVNGEGGLYQQLNLVEKKKMTVRNFKKLAETRHATPIHQDPTELDRLFWKNIFTNPSIYGADVPGTLYDEDCEEFNLTKLDTILDNIESDYGVTIQGVNTTYLYFGMWKSSFCWHTEDMDLYSINYLHTGQPKAWYCIAPEYGKRFERLAASFFPHSFRTCRAFLRHKTSLISPYVLRKYSIPFSREIQKAGEFMVTFPYSYHSGFNHGFNIAEATNFALEYWIDFGKWATRCECSSESVKISMQTFVKRYQSDRYDNWLRGKDICKDPRDPKHIAAAPKPTEYDLYLIGIHGRDEEEEQKEIEESHKKQALQQNQSSNVKIRLKKIKTESGPDATTVRNFEELLNLDRYERVGDDNIQNEHYAPIPTDMVETQMYEGVLDLRKDIKAMAHTQPPDYEKVQKHLRKVKAREEKLRLKKEKRARERILSSNELLSFLPLNFTHEKRFNRCIAAQYPHCSVCQLLVPHPGDDRNIWGPRQTSVSDETYQETSGAQSPEASATTNSNLNVNTEPSTPVPQPTTAGPQVEEFSLPASSTVLLPRGLFMRDPRMVSCEIYDQARLESLAKKRKKSVESLRPKEDNQELSANDSGYEEKIDFLDLDLDTSDLIQCSTCMLSVHKLCYGLEKLPTNKKDWICDRCEEPNRSLISCALCPCRGGALKAINSDTWVHLTCAMSVPDIKFFDLMRPQSEKLQTKLPDIVERNPCYYCATNMNLPKYVQGKCVSCVGYWGPNEEQVECSKKFHTTCGHRNGARFDYFDLNLDPKQHQPIKAKCLDCYMICSKRKIEEDNEFEDNRNIASGMVVYVLSTQDGNVHKAIVEKRILDHYYDIYDPQTNTVDCGVNEKKIIGLDVSANYKVGDQMQYKISKDTITTGKFKHKHVRERFLVRFIQSKQQERVPRCNIYIRVDELPTQLAAALADTMMH